MDILDETKSSAVDFTNDLKLIKALLLHENNCSCTALVYKQKIADEWNCMEGKLQFEAFWTFINPNPDAPRYEFSRMGFVFEMLLRCEKDEYGNFVDVGAQLSRNKHYLSERCLSAMMDPETKEVPFLQCDKSLSELINEEFGLPVVPKEITCGMFALWFAVKVVFGRLWSWFCFGVLDNPQNCFTTETGEAGCNVLRDFLTVMVETDEEELIPTGRTLGDYLDLEAEVDDWR